MIEDQIEDLKNISIQVERYGTSMPLGQIASITLVGGPSIEIKLWDYTIINDIIPVLKAYTFEYYVFLTIAPLMYGPETTVDLKKVL